MDRDQEQLQLLGFFGIFRESFRTIFSARKIFSQITLALICPLSLILLAHNPISHLFFIKFYSKDTIFGSDSSYSATLNSTHDASDVFFSSRVAFWGFKAVYFIFAIIFALLSTSAVVYTIACIYAAKQITFKRVMRVVPRVWKRLLVTFLWSFAIVFVFNLVSIMIMVLWFVLIPVDSLKFPVLCILVILYLMGSVYIAVVWHLASVISVLEELRGLKALKKGKELIKGKLVVSVCIFVLLFIFFAGIEVMFEFLSFFGMPYPDVALRILFGILSFSLLVILVLVGLVIQTVIYFVCKSYHHESIDRASLGCHLEAYLGDYVRLKENHVQMEQLNV